VAGFRLDVPWPFALTTAALTRTGAKITVYENGTTTKVNLFSDRACTVAAANPIESVAGYFPVRYVATAALHTLLWEDSDGSDRLSANDIAPFADSQQANPNNQALDAGLTAFAALTISANKLPYGTGSDTFATTDFTAFARQLLDDADAPTACATLNAWSIANTASAANIRANTADKVIDTDAAWSSVASVALTDAATVAVDMSAGVNFTLAIAGNRTLGQPTNQKVGQSGWIEITQDGAGSRTLAYHSSWKFAGGTDPTLSTAGGSIDVLYYTVLATDRIAATLVKAIA
jgi:hypothetical protein